jgi:hypothetical protein
MTGQAMTTTTTMATAVTSDDDHGDHNDGSGRGWLMCGGRKSIIAGG